MKYLFIYKKHNTILCIIFFNTIFSSINLFSQSTSPGIFFQAIARDNYTNPAKDRTIFVQSSIIKGAALGNKVFTEIKASITPIDEKITLLKFPQDMVIRNDHNFRVNFQNSKAAITMISMALIILLSFGGNIWQLNRNSQLKDNDLKYRYIKSTNGINPANLNMLEDVFYYQRDKTKIREIRVKVENYEREVKEMAEEIERGRKNDVKKVK